MGNILKGLVNKGQPQGLGNKIVTYDGLIDFLEMLKYEVPRMGQGNEVDSLYSYGFGKANSLHGDYSFMVGSDNAGSGDYDYCFGFQNQADADYALIMGDDNVVTGRFSTVIGQSNNVSNGDFISIFGEKNGDESDPIRGEHIFIVGKKNVIGDGEAFSNIAIFGQNNSLHTSLYNSKILGDNNTIDADQEGNNYIIGYNNTTERVDNGWIIGYNINCQESNNVFIIGHNNGSGAISNSNIDHCFILGHGNALQNTNSVYMFGTSLQQPDDLPERWYPTYVLGTCNAKLSRVINNDPNSSESKFNAPAVIIGNGYGATDTVYRNLLVLDYNGGVEIANGHLRSQFTFDNHVYVKGELSLGSGSEDTSSACKIVDRNDNTDRIRSYLYYDKGFRHVLQPWNDTGVGNYNEAIWNVNDTSAAIRETVLHINASNYHTKYQLNDKIITSDTGGTFRSNIDRYTHYAPDEIHFHAGKVDNWANIKCGTVQAVASLNSKEIEATTSIKCGDNVSIFPDWVTTKKLKVNSLNYLYLSTFSFTSFTSTQPSNAGVYLVRAEFTYDNWTYKTNTGIIVVDKGSDMSRRTVLFSVNDGSWSEAGDQTYRVLVDADPNDSPSLTVQRLRHDGSASNTVAWLDITVTNPKCVFIPLFAKEYS